MNDPENMTCSAPAEELVANEKSKLATGGDGDKLVLDTESIKSTTVTRIGRPCNTIPKPAVPRQSTAGDSGGKRMTSASSMRNFTDELPRRHTSDVKSAPEETQTFSGGRKWSKDRKSSDGSLSSDCYGDPWKLDQERRRSSDLSFVLTQDTDSFIIGDRVWVGGTKAGQIAYIGETQFAPGEWAGVVLDEAIGKNDGSVANIRYFQCEPKKGIFSRLTRLTRYPISGGSSVLSPSDYGKSSEASSGKQMQKKLSSSQSSITTTGRSIYSKPSSPDSSIHPNVSVGDRVIVMSSQGSKAGVLRFLGATDFAPGEWCGVELDDPVGKNDGSVAGTRYFECRPRFGLFAPLHKVSKSPANRRPSQATCQIHRGGGSSGIRRQSSKESLTSMSSIGSAVASVRSNTRKVGVRTPTTPTSTTNALQEVLKEKEAHIELLLKERDLERAEITRAASQADEAEKRLAIVQQEFEQRKEESEARIADLDALLCLLKSENEEISGQLEEERKKYEDLQFRFEEVTIEKGDLTLIAKNSEEKITMLEKNLEDERKRVEVLELESNKLFEAEEQLMNVKEENDVLRETVAKNERDWRKMEQERLSIEAIAAALRAEVESLKSEALENKSIALCKKLDDTETDAVKEELARQSELLTRKEIEHSALIKALQEDHNLRLTEMSKNLAETETSFNSKMKVAEQKLQEKTRICQDLEIELEEMKLKLSKMMSKVAIEEEKRNEIERKFEQELSECHQSAKRATAELELEMEKSRNHLETIEKYKENAAEVEKKLTIALTNNDKQFHAMKETIQEQEQKLELAREHCKKVSTEYDSLKETFAATAKEHDSQLQQLSNIISEKESQIQELTITLESMQKDFAEKLDQQSEFSARNAQDLESKVKELSTIREQQRKELDTLRIEVENQCLLLNSRDVELHKERELKEEFVEKLGTIQDRSRKLELENDSLQLEIGDLSRRLQAQEEKLLLAVSQKEKLESDLANFIDSKKDTSAQLTDLNKELRLKEKKIDTLHEELRNQKLDFQREQQQHKKELACKEVEFDAMRQKLVTKEKEIDEQARKSELKLQAFDSRAKELETKWQMRIDSYEKETHSVIEKYKEEISELKRLQVEKDDHHKKVVQTLENAKTELEERLVVAQSDLLAAKDDMVKKHRDFSAEREQLIDNLEKLKAQKTQNEEAFSEREKSAAILHESEISSMQKSLDETNVNLVSLATQLENVRREKNNLEKQYTELLNKCIVFEKQLEIGERNRTELESRLPSIEKEKEILQGSVQKLREEKWILDSKLTENILMLAEMKSQLDSMEESKRKLEQEVAEKAKSLMLLQEKLDKSEKSSTRELLEKETMVKTLQIEIGTLKQSLSHADALKEAQSKETESAVESLKSELETATRQNRKSDEETVKLKENLTNLTNQLSEESKKNEERLQTITRLEKIASEMNLKIEAQETALREANLFRVQMEELSKLANNAEKSKESLRKLATENKELSDSLSETRSSLLAKETLISAMSEEIEALKKENVNILNNNKIIVESMEEEKHKLQRKIADMHTESPNAPPGLACENCHFLDDREFSQGQVDFLNSVIVDMQKKNDALKARIEILEMGFSPEDVEDFTLGNIKRTATAPRLFCDICEVFDLHETEDCPKQATDKEETLKKSSKSKVPPPQRPYCEICEIFGHDTSECDDGETF